MLGKSFFRRNTLCIARENGAAQREKARHPGALAVFRCILNQKRRDVGAEGRQITVRVGTERHRRMQLQTAQAEQRLCVEPRRAADEPDVERIAVDRIDKLGDLNNRMEYHSKFFQRKPPGRLYNPTFFGYNEHSDDRFRNTIERVIQKIIPRKALMKWQKRFIRSFR